MTDQAQCIPQSTDSGFPRSEERPIEPEAVPSVPTGPDLQIALRETFLWRFHRPAVAAAFRVVGDGLFELLNEAGQWGPPEEGPSPQATYGEVRAACADLGHVARYLDEVAAERQGSELDAVSEALAEEASGWAGRLAVLVTDMRRSLRRAEAFAGSDLPEDEPEPSGDDPNPTFN